MWRSLFDNKKYIGSHFGSLNDGYVSSSKYFNEIYNKNPDIFVREILVSGLSREDALSKEQELLCSINAANSEEFYNLHNYSGKGWCHHEDPNLSKIYYDRISKAKKGKPSPHKGKNIWKDHNRHKLRIDVWEIIIPSGEKIVRENMLNFCKEHKLNPSAMSAVARGDRRHYKGYMCRKLTNNRNIDYEYKEWKSKGKTGKALYGSQNPNAKTIEVNGIVYGSMSEAVSATGLSMYKLRKIKGYNNGK